MEELERLFSESQADLARNDLDKEILESKLGKIEKYTVEYYLLLEQLNSNDKKRQMIANRLGSLRIMITKIESLSHDKKKHPLTKREVL